MIIAISGTPGTGKTSVSKILEEKGYSIIDLNKIATQKGFIVGKDQKRDSKIVDITKLNSYIKKSHGEKDIVFVEGHLSHLLKCAEKIIIFRSHPSQLSKNLEKKGWNKDKIIENLEAETLDVILCEAADIHPVKDILEINTTDQSLDEIADIIVKILEKGFKNMKKYKIGNIDWSEEILKDFKV